MHTNTEFYDQLNARILGWQAAVKRACDRQPTSHPENLTAETICAVTGLLPLYPFEVPEGYVATGPMTIEIDGEDYTVEVPYTVETPVEYTLEDGTVETRIVTVVATRTETRTRYTARKVYATITIEQHEAQRAAYEAAQAIQREQDKQDALVSEANALPANLVEAYAVFAGAVAQAIPAAMQAGATIDPTAITYQGLIAALDQLQGEQWIKTGNALQALWNVVVINTNKTPGEAYAMMPVMEYRRQNPPPVAEGEV
jgi:hypothetical protein